jgi:hypothetical protein
MTTWQIPTHSFDSPKSLRKTIEREDDGIDAKHAPSRATIQAREIRFSFFLTRA